MWDIYKTGSNGYSTGADVVKSITPKILGPFIRNRLYPNHGKQEIEFAVPEPGDGETLKDINWVFLDSKAVPRDGADWISLKVTSDAKEFNGTSAKIAFLLLSVFRNVDKGLKLLNFLQPVLLLSYRSRHVSNSSISHASRHKRDLPEEYEEETNRIWDSDGKRRRSRNTCRRRPLYIEFSEIDYDKWIVAPTGYEAFQCVGKCTFPVSETLSPTKHAIVQTLMHHVSPSKVARACCVPTRLEPISILYIDSEGILTYRFHYQDMVVAECGCR
ncbi:UNVERIFIED_CONTAM: hypothetical protein PYX00_002779 [Menopon gallinae]|uniref:TGF-beta family profile domain-containing protein n=1 Tax=Menopon gallinae TaxID=328185 RepID=A0AAW2HXD4_9NEOP